MRTVGEWVGAPDAHRCPICDRRFRDKKALEAHLTYTRAHDGVSEELFRLRFLLAEAEREKEEYRLQRDAWRATARGQVA